MRTIPFSLALLALLASAACERGRPAVTGDPSRATRSSAPPPAATPPPPPAEPPVPSLDVAAVKDTDITLDGDPSDAAWARCGSTGALAHPGHGRPEPSSRVQADARFCWSPTALYVLAVVNESSPASPFARDDVDPHLWERASAVELMLQPGDPGDNRAYFEVQVDVNGATWDTRFDDYNRPRGVDAQGQPTYGHQDWNAQLRRAVKVDAEKGRYVVEMALPWTALSSDRTPVPPRAGDTWRANVYSFRDGQRDSLAWSPLLGKGNFHFSARFGRIRFAAAAP